MGYCLFLLKKLWRPISAIIVPIVLGNAFLLSATEHDKRLKTPEDELYTESAAAFTCILMAYFWISECMPLAITSFFPLIFFPVFDIMSTEQTCRFYLGTSIMLLLGGCLVAQAFEYSNLHTRIALKVLLLVGAQIPRLLFGLSLTAMFLSMWMNNTSTTSMMVPIVHVISAEFDKAYMAQAVRMKKARVRKELSEHLGNEQAEIVILEMEAQHSDENPEALSPEEIEAKTTARNIQINFLLAVAWCSNIGGIGVSIGTAVNLIAIENLEKWRHKVIAKGGDDKVLVKNETKCAEALDLGFLTWMQFSTLPMFLCTLATYAILLVAITGVPKQFPRLKCCRKSDQAPEIKKRDFGVLVTSNITRAIKAKYAQLGPMTLHEKLVLILGLIMVGLWMTGSTFWWKFFKCDIITVDESATEECVDERFLTNYVTGLFVCMFLFVIPKEKKYYKRILRGSLYDGLKDPLLKWSMVQTDLPWGPLVMIGGGTCISAGIKESGLSTFLKTFLQDTPELQHIDDFSFLLLIILITAILTSIASNTAIIAMLAPVLVELSKTKHIHPILLILAASISCSFAFILPVSTPPNAVVYDKSDMKQKEMAIPGAFVTVICNIILIGCIYTYGDHLFQFSEYKKSENQYCSIVSDI